MVNLASYPSSWVHNLAPAQVPMEPLAQVAFGRGTGPHVVGVSSLMTTDMAIGQYYPSRSHSNTCTKSFVDVNSQKYMCP